MQGISERVSRLIVETVNIPVIRFILTFASRLCEYRQSRGLRLRAWNDFQNGGEYINLIGLLTTRFIFGTWVFVFRRSRYFSLYLSISVTDWCHHRFNYFCIFRDSLAFDFKWQISQFSFKVASMLLTSIVFNKEDRFNDYREYWIFIIIKSLYVMKHWRYIS